MTERATPPPSDSSLAFRRRLEAIFARVLPAATQVLGDPPITAERYKEALEQAGRSALPDLQAAVEELQQALRSQRPPRLVEYWTPPTDALERLIVAAVGFRSLGLPTGRPLSRSVLERLHGRAVLTAWEVATLVRASLPSGAAARWRSLHELAVAAVVIAEFGEEIAERFAAHEAVRRRRVFRQFGEHGDAWELMPMPPGAVEQVEEEYQRALERYGESFKGDHEWARPAVSEKKGRLNITDLEDAVGGAPWRVKYAVASEHVHPGDSGAPLDDHGWDNPYLLGRWTTHLHGLPGAQAAMSLTSITNALVRGSLDPDDEGSEATASILLAGLEALRRRVDDEFAAVEDRLFAQSFPGRTS